MFDIRNSFQFVLSNCIILGWLGCVACTKSKNEIHKK